MRSVRALPGRPAIIDARSLVIGTLPNPGRTIDPRGPVTKPAAKAAPPAPSEASGPILPDNIGFHIRIVQMRIFREFYRMFENSGVSPGMHTVLAIIRDNPGIRQRSLAEILMVREPNMTRMIQSLQGSELISRQVDRSDRRAFHLYLTAKGQELMGSLAERINSLEELLLGPLNTQERGALRDYLNRILENIEQ
ncbi:MAG: MarR family transcriptional regulator [Caulobacteraceae bacterium]|jgi:DNA-binding MarR family transcriptional regulator|nr:MarR family transcriptional regulator [Caulobacteraceae bacterium]